MANYEHYKDYTFETYLCGSWQVSPEVDLAWHYSALRQLLDGSNLTDFDIRVERADQGGELPGEVAGKYPNSDGLRFSLTVPAKSKKSARKKADGIFSLLFP